LARRQIGCGALPDGLPLPAVTIVQWFQRGLVKHNDQSG
jgi:hypothetical protein